jgi:hypothetical protein
MRCFITPEQALHAPADEFFRGQRVPCFENPSRARFVEQALRAAGHTLHAPDSDSASLLDQVHAPRYLDFCARPGSSGWRWTPATPRCNPFPRCGRCARCAATSSRTTSSPAWACIRWTTAAPGCRHLGSGQGGCRRRRQRGARVGRASARPSAATRPPGHHAGPDFMGGYCFSTTPPWPRRRCATGGAARVAVLDVDYHHGNGTQASSTTAPTCCSSASTATRAPNTRSTWAMPMKPARAPGRAATSTCRWPRAAAWRRGSTRWRWPARALQRHRPTRWWCRWGWIPSPATRSRALPCSGRFHPPGPAPGAPGPAHVFVLEGGYAAAELGTTR